MHVHDEAHVLTQPTIDKLEQQLITYQDSSSNEIAVLIVPTLEDDALENYSLRVVEKWELGKKNKDNGVLLLIVVDDHKIRIETGYGLEGVLTDAKTSRIIRNEIAPHFRQNQYDEGVIAGINAITKAIGGEYTDDDDGGLDAAELEGTHLDRIIYFWNTWCFHFYGFGYSWLWRMVFVRFSDTFLRGVSNDSPWYDWGAFRIGILCHRISHCKINVGTNRLGQADCKENGHCQSEWGKGMDWRIRLVIRRRG